MAKLTCLLTLLFCLSGCAFDQSKEDPNLEEVYYPASVLHVSTAGRTFVSNTAFDREFDKGHLTAVTSDGVIDPDASLLTGMFGGQLSISAFSIDGERLMVLPTRDQDQIEVFRVSEAPAPTVRHVETLVAMGRRGMASGPMSSLWHGQYFLVGHSSARTVSAWRVSEDDGDIEYGCSLFVPAGVHYMALGPQSDEVYVSSRFSGLLSVLDLEEAGWGGDPSARLCRLVLRRTVDTESSDVHGLTFGAAGDSLYVSSIIDGSVSRLSVGKDEENDFGERVEARRWVGEGAGLIRVNEGDGRLYLANTDAQRILQLEPLTLTTLGEVELSGRPFDFDFMLSEAGKSLMLVSLFADHQLRLIEIDGSALSENGTVGVSP